MPSYGTLSGTNFAPDGRKLIRYVDDFASLCSTYPISCENCLQAMGDDNPGNPHTRNSCVYRLLMRCIKMGGAFIHDEDLGWR